MSAILSATQQQIVNEALSAGVDPAIALAVAQMESGFNQGAIGSSGEVGVFQLMPATAVDLGVNAYDPTGNIQGGIRYLGQLYSRFGNWSDALAAYNWGPGNVMNSGGSYPAVVASYVSRVLNYASSYSASLGNAGPAIAASSPAAIVAPVLDSLGMSSLVPYLPTTALGMAGVAVFGAFVLAWLLD